jgi:hypothetical protein
VLAGLAARGVDVRGLLWRAHPRQAHFAEQDNVNLAAMVDGAGGEVLLDERGVVGKPSPEAVIVAPERGSHCHRVGQDRSATGAGTTRTTSGIGRRSTFPSATARDHPGTISNSRFAGPRSVRSRTRSASVGRTRLPSTIATLSAARCGTPSSNPAGDARCPPSQRWGRSRAGRTRCRCCGPIRRNARRPFAPNGSGHRADTVTLQGLCSLVYLEDQASGRSTPRCGGAGASGTARGAIVLVIPIATARPRPSSIEQALVDILQRRRPYRSTTSKHRGTPIYVREGRDRGRRVDGDRVRQPQSTFMDPRLRDRAH